MPSHITKRAWTAIAASLCLAAVAGGGWYIRRSAAPQLPRVLAGASLGDVVAGTPPEILRALPDGYSVVAYIDATTLRKLKDSPLAAMLGIASARPREDRDYQNFVRDSGFDYARDMDTLAVAIWPSSAASTAGGASANRVVAIVDGRFDRPKIEAYALRTGKAATSGTHTVYEVPGDTPGQQLVALEFLSSSRMALASGKDAKDLLAKVNPSAQDEAMQARIRRVASAPIFAIVQTDHLPNTLYNGLQNSSQLMQVARSIQGLALAGQPAGDDLLLVLEGECASAKDAQELSTLLDGFRIIGSMALKDPKTAKQMTQQQAAFADTLLSQIKVSQQDRSVRLAFELTPTMLAPANPGR